MTMNFDTARTNMIAQQIRTWDVLDERVLDCIARIPREDFVPEQYRKLAFTDMALPLGSGESMLPPKLEARLLQELGVRPQDRVLEIGTGSGYITALLASLGQHVFSVEVAPELKLRAAENLTRQGIKNVTLEVGDAALGWSRHAPYDVILVGGSLPLLPAQLRSDLAEGGRLIAVVGTAPVMEVKLITRTGDRFAEKSLFETVLPPLRNAPQPDTFRF